jgi:hypothetical protein
LNDRTFIYYNIATFKGAQDIALSAAKKFSDDTIVIVNEANNQILCSVYDCGFGEYRLSLCTSGEIDAG